jgi:signal transduction histidine kinase
MPASRLPAWLPIAAILVLAGGALGWLYFGFAGEGNDVVQLVRLAPVAATATEAGWRTEFLVDENGPDALDALVALPATAWRPPRTDRGLLGTRAGRPTWLRVTWRNPRPRAVRGIVTTGDMFVDEFDAWIGDEAGGWRHERTGESVAAREKSIAGRQAAVAIDMPARGERTAYLRFANATEYGAFPQWWPNAEAFQRSQTRALVADGIYFGGLLALLGYNLVLWVRLRFADIGWYVLYLGTMLVFLLLAQAQPLVFGWPTRSPWLETVLVLALAATGIFLAQFARVFLELTTCLPRGERVLGWARNGLLVLAAGALTIPWTGYHGYNFWVGAVALGVVATHALLAGLAVAAWRAGVRQARFFLAAFGCVFAGALTLAVLWFTANQARYAGLSTLMIGSALEMLLLSLAVADRFAQTQTKLVEETEQRRAIEEAYADELEIEVRERTAELAAANEDKDRMLVALGHDLRGPLAALTQRAEQLRQKNRARREATPTEELEEFSGEAAGSGRRMLLLIEDIVLWARLRTGARVALGTHTASGLVNPVAMLHQPLAATRNVSLVTAVPEALRVHTDLVLAQTLVRNLVANAVKAAHGHVRVTARAADAAGTMITVRDDGPGLPASALARLRGEGGAEGEAGMGLRLIREIGAALGATIVTTTPDDGGTEISVTLPAAASGES